MDGIRRRRRGDDPDDYSAEVNGVGPTMPRDFNEAFLQLLGGGGP